MAGKVMLFQWKGRDGFGRIASAILVLQNQFAQRATSRKQGWSCTAKYEIAADDSFRTEQCLRRLQTGCI